MTSSAERPVPAPVRWSRRVLLDEQVRAKDPRPIGNGSSYVREGLVVEPGELKEFLESVHESRQSGVRWAYCALGGGRRR